MARTTPGRLLSFETNPPILPSLKSFPLHIATFCDFHSLNVILHCMPNLHQLILTIISTSLNPTRYLDV
ncbi:hypothetical protein I4U23_019631 [Adineta vaga]|nr:hypothetical protein I4U23_019631 [Adineta vaga]